MSWENTQRYRFKVVVGQIQVERIKSTGTLKITAMAECTAGPQAGQRMRWLGYLNSPANKETALAELRVMGWRGAKLGEWSGLGAIEFEGTAKSEVGSDNKTYWRLSWPRAIAKLKTENAVTASDLDAINAELGDLLAKPAAALPPAPSVGDEQADIDFP